MTNNNYKNEINKVYESINTSLATCHKAMNDLYASHVYKDIKNINYKIKDILGNVKINIPKIPNFKVDDVVSRINKNLSFTNTIIPIAFDLQPINNVICPIEIKIMDGDNVVDSIIGYFILKE